MVEQLLDGRADHRRLRLHGWPSRRDRNRMGDRAVSRIRAPLHPRTVLDHAGAPLFVPHDPENTWVSVCPDTRQLSTRHRKRDEARDMVREAGIGRVAQTFPDNTARWER